MCILRTETADSLLLGSRGLAGDVGKNRFLDLLGVSRELLAVLGQDVVQQVKRNLQNILRGILGLNDRKMQHGGKGSVLEAKKKKCRKQ
jgi:hypothetical protein